MIILKPWAVYNEIEEYAADWLENLITLGAIAPGIVDRRSIVDVRPDDYRGFRQAHFFAGIGVWSYALRRAGVSDDTALWTGSCPCQPFSAAGAGGGVDDERHLWPHWFHLIGAARPPKVYGEQVASKDGLGWLDLVCADLEGSDYSIWAVDTCSASGGAPHIRQRIRFSAEDLRLTAGGLADISGERWHGLQDSTGTGGRFGAEASCGVGRMDDSLRSGLEGLGDGHCPTTGQRQGSLRPVATTGGIDWVADNHHGRAAPAVTGLHDNEHHAQPRGGALGLADHIDQQRQTREPGISTVDDAGGREQGSAATARLRSVGGPRPTNGFWGDADWLFCRDGKWRPTQPGAQPLVNGSAFHMGSGSTFEGKSRQGMLKGYGNAIDAEATTDFIEATLEPDTIDLEPLGDDTDGLL